MSRFEPNLEEIRGLSDWLNLDIGYTEIFTMSPAFERVIRAAQAHAIRDVATGFIDWDILYGHEPSTPEHEEAMKTVDYLERMADEIEAGQ